MNSLLLSSVKFFILFLVITLLVSIPLPGFGAEKKITQEKPTTSQKFLHSLELIFPKTVYQLKEPIPIRLILTNKTDEVFRLTFSSTQRYDFIITKEEKEIWRWSKDKLFATILEEILLRPQESLCYTEIWEQKDNKGKFTVPGKYKIIGRLKTYPEIVSEALNFEIK